MTEAGTSDNEVETQAEEIGIRFHNPTRLRNRSERIWKPIPGCRRKKVIAIREPISYQGLSLMKNARTNRTTIDIRKRKSIGAGMSRGSGNPACS